MKITHKEITENIRALGGTQYRGLGYTIPMVWLTKRTVLQFDRLRSKLMLSVWHKEGVPCHENRCPNQKRNEEEES